MLLSRLFWFYIQSNNNDIILNAPFGEIKMIGIELLSNPTKIGFKISKYGTPGISNELLKFFDLNFSLMCNISYICHFYKRRCLK